MSWFTVTMEIQALPSSDFVVYGILLARMTTTLPPFPGHMLFNLTMWLALTNRKWKKFLFSVWLLSLFLKKPWSICSYLLALKVPCKDALDLERMRNQMEKETKWRKKPDRKRDQMKKETRWRKRPDGDRPSQPSLSIHPHWGSRHVIEAIQDQPTSSQFHNTDDPRERRAEEPPSLAQSREQNCEQINGGVLSH